MAKNELKQGSLIDFAIGCCFLFLYITNKFFNGFHGILSPEMLSNHFNDFCGGGLFPAYVNCLCAAVGTRAIVNSISRLLIIEAVCSAAWELVAPLLVTNSTGDPLDVASYFIGGILFYVCRMIAQQFIRMIMSI